MPDQEKPRVKYQGIPRVGSIPIRPRPDHLGLASRKKEQLPDSPEERPSHDTGELKGVYIISVAARILEMHPQTLRKYERLGLVRPSRTIGMLRLYSEYDIEKLRLIRHLEENLGLNLAGVEFTLNLLSHLLDMRQRLSSLSEAQGMEEAERFFSVVEQEVVQLFQRLNLPIQE